MPLSALTLVSPPLLSCDRPRSALFRQPAPSLCPPSVRAASLTPSPACVAAPYEPSVGFMLAGFICMGVLFGCPILKIFKDKVKSKLEAKEQSGP